MSGHDNESTKAQVEEFARDLNNRALQCRLYGCQKMPSEVRTVRLEGTRRMIWETVLVCRNRCGCWWDQLVDPQTGMELSRLRKHYPARGYLAPGIGRIYGDKKAILRLEHITRRYADAKDAQSAS